MRYLRHAPLTFWLAVVLALGGIIVASFYAGRDLSTTLVINKTFGDPRGDAQAMLERVSGVYPSITSLELREWSYETARQADVGLSRHLSFGGFREDDVGLAWSSVAEAARTLAVEGPNDSSTALTGVSRLGQAVQNLVAIADGLIIQGATVVLPTRTTTNSIETGDRYEP
jgi:hypothetical protein